METTGSSTARSSCACRSAGGTNSTARLRPKIPQETGGPLHFQRIPTEGRPTEPSAAPSSPVRVAPSHARGPHPGYACVRSLLPSGSRRPSLRRLRCQVEGAPAHALPGTEGQESSYLRFPAPPFGAAAAKWRGPRRLRCQGLKVMRPTQSSRSHACGSTAPSLRRRRCQVEGGPGAAAARDLRS